MPRPTPAQYTGKTDLREICRDCTIALSPQWNLPTLTTWSYSGVCSECGKGAQIASVEVPCDMRDYVDFLVGVPALIGCEMPLVIARLNAGRLAPEGLVSMDDAQAAVAGCSPEMVEAVSAGAWDWDQPAGLRDVIAAVEAVA